MDKLPCKTGPYNLCKVCDNELSNCQYKNLSPKAFLDKYENSLTYSNWSQTDIINFKSGNKPRGKSKTFLYEKSEGDPDLPYKKPPFNLNFDNEGPEFPYPITIQKEL